MSTVENNPRLAVAAFKDGVREENWDSSRAQVLKKRLNDGLSFPRTLKK